MSLGVLLAITPDQRAKLMSLDGDEARLNYVKEELEVECFGAPSPDGGPGASGRACELDKAWYGLARALRGLTSSVGEWLDDSDPECWGDATYPLDRAIMGPRRVVEAEHEVAHIVRLVEPEEVADVAAALEALTEEELETRFRRANEDVYPEAEEEWEVGYAREYFEAARDFYRRFAGSGMAIVFAADQ